MFQLQSSVRHVSFFAGAKGDPGVNGVKGERGKVVCVCVCVCPLCSCFVTLEVTSFPPLSEFQGFQ